MRPVARLTFSRGTLVLEGMAAAGIERIFTVPWTFDVRAGMWRCDAIHNARVREELAARCFGFEDLIRATPRSSWPKVDLLRLRGDQHEAIAGQKRSPRG
jgi:hypothetical protein